MSNISKLNPTEEENYNIGLNQYMKDFINAIPFVEIGDTSDGQFIKLKVQERDGKFSMGEIFFELQWMLHVKKHRSPDVTKIIVSDLQLTPIIPNSTFRRGIMIKVKYV